MQHTFAKIVFCVLLSPGASLAECLTTADMEQGALFTFDNQDTTSVRALGAGMVEVVEYYAATQTAMQFQSYLGPYNLRQDDLGMNNVMLPDKWARTIFDADLTELPVPAPGLPTWTGTAVWEEFGILPQDQIFTADFTAGEAVTLSDCTYDVVLVKTRVDRPVADHWYEQYSYYFPALGASVIVAWNNADEGFRQALPVAVERLK